MTRHVYRFNDMGYLDDVVQSLYVIDVDGGEARRLTDDLLMNAAPQWSPDGKELLLISSMYPDTHKTFYGRLRVIDVASGEIAHADRRLGAGDGGGLGCPTASDRLRWRRRTASRLAPKTTSG